MFGGQEKENEGIWSELHTIRSYDIDVTGQVTAESILKYFQEAAWNHAEQLGRGYSHLRQRNLAWVLSRIKLVVDSFPAWGQSVVVRTWPCGSKSLFALRDFALSDETGHKLLGATSSWIVLDLQTRRPQRIEPILGSMRTFPEHRAVGSDAEKLEAVADGPSPEIINVRYSDLDLNDHVNNSTYARWVLDSYPMEFHHSYRIRNLSFNFLAELKGDDSVALTRREIGELQIAHVIRRLIDGAEACRAEILWCKRD